MERRMMLVLVLFGCLVCMAGCGDDVNESGGTIDGDADGDSDTDGDADGDADSDSDADSDTDADGDTDADADSDGEGDCLSDGDCPYGECVAVSNGGWNTCTSVVDEATEGSSSGAVDECTTSADCEQDAGCYLTDFSMGVFYQYNTCIADECQGDEDCAENQICVPAGAWSLPRNKCLTALCSSHADCQDGDDGVCAPTVSTCYGLPQALQGFYCHYAVDECVTNADCDSGQQCQQYIGGTLENFRCQFEPCPAK